MTFKFKRMFIQLKSNFDFMEIGDITRGTDTREKLFLSFLNVKTDFSPQQRGEKAIIRTRIEEGKSEDSCIRKVKSLDHKKWLE